ncbi:glutamate synthase large subunit, partial [PVC group bacterium]|nr:glutamate synthase large subunit [PVC group bacterium]
MSLVPQKQGLYDPAMEHDACGVGFIVQMEGKKSHTIIRNGLTILENLAHRGACGCDPLTGDGAGITTQVPDKFLRKECQKNHIVLPPEGEYGVGNVFLPPNLEERNAYEEWFEQIIHGEGQKFLGWRDIPHDSSQIGKVAHSVEPEFRQIFIQKDSGIKDQDAFERKLYVIRKLIEKKVWNSHFSQQSYFHIASLSTRTLVYKGQLMSDQLDRFYLDLRDESFESCLAMVHSRYSTNTFPSWPLAHPYRMLSHNGEINTLRGNINWSHAREMLYKSELFGDDIHKIHPIIQPGGSDSAAFDNVLEMLVLTGRSLPHAVMMMIPEAWSGHTSMDEDKRAFYEYHACLMEPWDGPASIAFTDGRYIGAVLDRNGLRPSRYYVTKDHYVIMASEAGVLEIPPNNVLLKGRLQPGKMFLVDTNEGRIIDDTELKRSYATKKPYKEWLKENLVHIDELPKPKRVLGLDKDRLLERQQAFGYTLEDLKLILKPMVEEGKEATGSMGNDAPLAVLSNKPQLLYNYFKQLFAQVTNPPVDAIREEIIMGPEMFLGAEGNQLDEVPEHCRRLKINEPIISNEDLEKIREFNEAGLTSDTLKTIFLKKDGVKGLEVSLENLFGQADQAIKKGHTLLILSDRDVSQDHVPMPALLACSGLHHHLIRNGKRTKVSLIIETGEAREMHQFALLIGYGANAVNPYLAFETIQYEIEHGDFDPNLAFDKAVTNYIKATRIGLYKIISKMGISTIQSYCGAQIFEAVGLGDELVEKYFTATPSRIGGIGIETLAEEMLARHRRAYPPADTDQYEYKELDIGGHYYWRREGEFHQINPQMIALLQHATRSGDSSMYKKYASLVNDQSKNRATLRGLLKFKKGNSIPINDVEPAKEIVKRFATGAMSYGSISKEAHETLAIAMNRMGGFSNTGEGGEDPDRFQPDSNGDLRRSRIKQVAQGRFGVTIEYLVNADQLQIKMAQGAKPGEGGQLPGYKVSKEIAKTRSTTPGVGLISPPPHHDIYSIEDLAQLIHDLKNANRFADVSVKLVAEFGV